MATDVASRGIHVNNVAHVINYDLPQIPEDFIHRVGRTGRMGSAGRASTLVSGAEIGELRSIERALKLKIVRKQLNAAGVVSSRVVTILYPHEPCRACRARCSRKLSGASTAYNRAIPQLPGWLA